MPILLPIDRGAASSTEDRAQQVARAGEHLVALAAGLDGLRLLDAVLRRGQRVAGAVDARLVLLGERCGGGVGALVRGGLAAGCELLGCLAGAADQLELGVALDRERPRAQQVVDDGPLQAVKYALVPILASGST